MKAYEIDLDLPPNQRWNEILDDYKEILIKVIPHLKKIIDTSLGYSYYIIYPIIKAYILANKIKYYEELQAIAIKLNISFQYVLLLQLCYEASTCCTSAVTKIENNYTMFRTMDWPLDFLKKLTIDLIFTKKGKVVFYATSWVGYIGILTATVPKKYSLAVNYRRTENITFNSIIKNTLNVMKMHWPIGYLIREVCTNNLSNIEMKDMLCNSALVAPCYITICFADREPEIITRDTNNFKIHKNKFVVQTNCDQNKISPDILYSVERRNNVTKLFTNNTFKHIDELLINILKYPVINNETIYYCVMDPMNGVHVTTIT